MILLKFYFKVVNPIRTNTSQFLLLLLFSLLSITATSEATSKYATASSKLRPLNADKSVLSSGAAPLPLPLPLPPSTTNTNYHLSDAYAWGHNTRYSTVIFDENITVKGSTILDIKYPNAGFNNQYAIIGVHTFAIDKLQPTDISVLIVEGGIERNFVTIRFASRAPDDVEFNLKIFGVNV